MSFASDCKKELCGLALEKPCCQLSELSALFMAIGSLNLLGRGRVAIQFACENMAVARRIYTLMDSALGVTPQVHYVSNTHFGGRRKAVLTLGPMHSPAFLYGMNMLTEKDGVESLRSMTPNLPLTRGCCMRSFLRGAMLGNGTITNPELGYHMELPFHDETMRLNLAKCLLKQDLPVKQSHRKEQGYLYYKQCEQIVTFLTAVGAHKAVMKIEDLRVKRQVFGDVTRAVNCDNANMNKMMEASDAQIAAIEKLLRHGQLNALPPGLQEIAVARLNMPAATLTELGQSLKKPIGKSGVNHRLRRLMALAEELE
ncbi:MAG: DNA-binding protein WhiA [Clostridia bacterium]|nr:DNA-binding protein WhiA [Clostridia bacterium]